MKRLKHQKLILRAVKKNIGEIQQSLFEILGKLQRRINILNNKKLDKLSAKQQTVLTNIEDSYKKGQYLQGIITYLKTANDSFDGLQEELKIALDVNPDEQSGTQRASSANVLNRMKAFINSNSAIIEDVIEALDSQEFKSSELTDLKDESKELLGTLKANISLLRKTYNKKIVNETAKFLLPFGWNLTPKQLEKVLDEATKDITFTQTWFDAMNVCGDRALRLIAKSVEDTKELARLETFEIQQDLIKLKKKLEESGIKDTEFMVGRTSDGVQSGDFVTEMDWDWFNEVKNKFYNKLNKKYGINKDFTIEDLKKKDKDKYKKYKAESDKFYREHTLSKEEVVKLIKRKEKELSEVEFDKWKKLNTRINPEQKEIGYKYTIPIKENAKYKDIASNPLKLEYYNKITDLKVKFEDSFPDRFKDYRRMPQIRRDTIERIKKGDLKGVLSDLQEAYKVMEDEDERGNDFRILDEAGNVVNFLPIYFTKRLAEPKHLSTDITSSMISFVNMANDRKHMMKIMDNLELAKDVIKNRKTLDIDAEGKPIKSIIEVLGEKVGLNVTRNTTSNMYKRLLEYFNMSVYGIHKVEGKHLFGMDVEKAIDSFAGYTAIVQLGLNIYAGINNVNTGKAMMRVEAASKEYFSPGDLFYADGVYGKELPKTLGNIGQRLHDDKMGLWLLKHDTMENYSEYIASLDAERKTIFGQMFSKSALFFLTRAGEHYIHSKGSIALANNFRFDTNSKSFKTKKEFYESLELIQAEMRSELANIPKKEYKNLSKKIKDKYEPKIKSEKDKLDKQWKEMTNYWDAHEVVDNNLKLKKEFKSDSWKQDHLKFKNLQDALNRQMHGNYVSHSVAIQKYALGRILMMFHKWIKPYWNRRYQKLQLDDNRRSEIEGYYNTVWRFSKQLIKDLKAGQGSLMMNWDQLNSVEKGNFRKALTEVSFTIGAAILASIIMSLKGDDDDDWMLNMMAYQANRAFTELGVMTPTPLLFSESIKLVREPIAGLSAADDLINLLKVWNWFDVIERGRYADMYKIERGLIKAIPLVKTVHDYSYPEEKLIFYNTFK